MVVVFGAGVVVVDSLMVLIVGVLISVFFVYKWLLVKITLILVMKCFALFLLVVSSIDVTLAGCVVDVCCFVGAVRDL